MLDSGCGHGTAAVVLARRGARVTAFDRSARDVAEAAARAQANRVRVTFLQADGHHLPFPNASFDRVWGNTVLHHLDLDLERRAVPGFHQVVLDFGANGLPQGGSLGLLLAFGKPHKPAFLLLP